MKRIAAVVLTLCLLLTAVPVLADGAYEFIKSSLMTVAAESDDLGTPLDFSATVSEVTGSTVLHINLVNKYIAICGRNASNHYECKLWSISNVNALAGYGAALLENYSLIDSQRTTADSFTVVVGYGEGDDDMLVVTDSSLAKQVADILMAD